MTTTRNGGPVALVLSGGGARAAYQVGLLRYLRRAFPDFRFQIITGTSAGAINAAYLAGHAGTLGEAGAGLADLWSNLTFDQVFRVDARALGKSVVRWGTRLLSGGAEIVNRAKGLLDTAPLRTLLSSVMATVSGELVGIGENVERGRLSALALTTLNWATGQTVTWIQGRDMSITDTPQRRNAKARIGIDHVMASAALPLLFPAVRIGSSWYGDGGVRLLAPLAPAIHLGADRILAVSTRYRRTQLEAEQPAVRGYPPPAQVIGTVLNAVFLDQVEQDAQGLKRINRLLAKLPPEQHGALRPIDLHILQPSEDLGKLAAEYQDALPQGLRFLTRGLGSHETRSADFLSLLLFHPDYLQRLIAVGERDAEAAHVRLAELLGATPAAAAAS
ncbi:MAG TPA: patatin-like phospholipase family protein [Thermoanaerobaculia bacterium]|nr:patatin-like phospholipase family protein [Thermoanaerobaculia bacterium]